MAEVRRTGDHSIWFNRKNYRQHSAETLFEKLAALQGGQQIELVFNGTRGIWSRYNDGQVALRPVDEAARQSWRVTEDRCGDWFPLVLAGDAQVLNPDAGGPRPETDAATQDRTITLCPTKRYARTSGATLCIGLDMTWWGGGHAKPESQNDAISYLVLGNDAVSSLEIERVSLAPTYNRSADQFTANCDADAEVILNALGDIIERYKAAQVVLAVDAPLVATTRQLPQRAKRSYPGTSARRAPEKALAEGLAAGPKEWGCGCKIQPGAPVCSRVKALVDALITKLNFRLYSHGSPGTPDKTLIECFPSEAIWALGCLRQYGTISPEQAREYKTFENRPLPLPSLMHAAYLNLVGFISAIGVPGPTVRAWIAQVSSTLLTDPRLGDSTGKLMRGGKLFDDVIDSVNCLFTAVAFSRDASHVWLGPDSEDGHIVGPGR